METSLKGQQTERAATTREQWVIGLITRMIDEFPVKVVTKATTTTQGAKEETQQTERATTTKQQVVTVEPITLQNSGDEDEKIFTVDDVLQRNVTEFPTFTTVNSNQSDIETENKNVATDDIIPITTISSSPKKNPTATTEQTSFPSDLLETYTTNSVITGNTETSTPTFSETETTQNFALSFRSITFSNANDVCESASCKLAAVDILKPMNHSVDPCDDFYKFACGRFTNDKSEKHRLFLLNLNRIGDNSPEYLKGIKIFYDSCVSHESEFLSIDTMQQGMFVCLLRLRNEILEW